MPVIQSQYPSYEPSLNIDNLTNGETVHQRCVLVYGRLVSGTVKRDEFVSVSTEDASNHTTFPVQFWPLDEGYFKALIILSPGINKLSFRLGSQNHEEPGHAITVNYEPLLDNPPLYLAIMIARDSPLTIDCPQVKNDGISSTHCSLEAAISKLRMTAYMWQALTAEDMRSKGIGRRSFRLEEEWAVDTMSQHFVPDAYPSALNQSSAMRLTAKIHLIRSARTTRELRDADVAQQNGNARFKDKLYDHFHEAMKAYGGPLDAYAHPIIAGMILDSHYSQPQNLIVGHAALGAHNPSGVSLGIFGSHLTYSWPRFLEEVSTCLVDTRAPGNTVGNDCGECGTLWEACSTGQGAFLHEVGHAFGAGHTTGIMMRGYAQHWPKNFVSRTAYCSHTRQSGLVVIDGQTGNDARWDLGDALSFSVLPHFRLPEDNRIPESARGAAPIVKVIDMGQERVLDIFSPAMIASVQMNKKTELSPTVRTPVNRVTYPLSELQLRFNPNVPLELQILGLNGKKRMFRNAWTLFFNNNYVRVPGSDVRLQKRSVTCKELEEGDMDKQFWEWATLLTHRNIFGKIKPATSVDVRTGAFLDGAYVYFGSTRVNCGPVISRSGARHSFGGHAAEAIHIPRDEEIIKVEVSRDQSVLKGLRIHLGNGVTKGNLSGGTGYEESCVLEAAQNERIVGFYGRSYWGEWCDALVEFGIITAPKNFELPSAVYRMKELQNTDGKL